MEQPAGRHLAHGAGDGFAAFCPAQRVERFEHGHVGFPAAVVFDALPERQPRSAVRSEEVDERTLAGACFAEDEDQLALHAARGVEAGLQPRECRVAADERGRRRTGRLVLDDEGAAVSSATVAMNRYPRRGAVWM